jgi:hypothetical protein
MGSAPKLCNGSRPSWPIKPMLLSGDAGRAPFLPPYHEVGRLSAGRRHGEPRGENRSSAAHVVTSPIGRPASIPSLPVPGNARSPSWRGAGLRDSGRSASGSRPAFEASYGGSPLRPTAVERRPECRVWAEFRSCEEGLQRAEPSHGTKSLRERLVCGARPGSNMIGRR